MNPYHYHGYMPQQIHSYGSNQDAIYSQPNLNAFLRQHPERQDLESRVNELERQNQQQVTELTRLNQEIIRVNGELNRINSEIGRLNQNDELHTGRLNQLNQRLRTVERHLNLPYTAGEDGF